ncbi:hypothetical protein ACOME3_001237 [Neoechinorhynchus agilis]
MQNLTQVQMDYSFKCPIKVVRHLKGWFEQNALISVDGNLFWLKYCASNRYVVPSWVQKRLFYQKAVCDCAGDELHVPKIILSSNGDLMKIYEMDDKIKLIVYILEYIPESETLNQAVESGKTEISILGRITASLHSRTAGNELFTKQDDTCERWLIETIDSDIDETISCVISLVQDEDRRDLLISCLSQMRIACKMYYPWMRRQWCHADVHDQNVLISKDGRLSLIDFGDAVFTYVVVDAAFLLFRSTCFTHLNVNAFFETVKQYNEGFRLNRIERKALYAFIIGLGALSISDAYESLVHDPNRAVERNIYIDRCFEALRFFVSDPHCLEYFSQF